MIRFLGKTFLFFVGLYVIVLITATVNADPECVVRAQQTGSSKQSSVMFCALFGKFEQVGNDWSK
jgi:hypothetical protein